MTTRPREYLTHLETLDRYPHVLRAMMWVALLSDGEATACLRDYREGRAWSGEAVNHYGGTRAVIQAAASSHARHATLAYHAELRAAMARIVA